MNNLIQKNNSKIIDNEIVYEDTNNLTDNQINFYDEKVQKRMKFDK